MRGLTRHWAGRHDCMSLSDTRQGSATADLSTSLRSAQEDKRDLLNGFRVVAYRKVMAISD
jgi:hypothetical protein